MARGLPNWRMSAPAMKLRPAPIITIARTLASASPFSRASRMPSRTPGPRAFTGGLSMVTMPTPSSTSNRTSGFSPAASAMTFPPACAASSASRGSDRDCLRNTVDFQARPQLGSRREGGRHHKLAGLTARRRSRTVRYLAGRTSKGESSMSYAAPFAGLKVVDLSQGVAGPYCGMLLAQHGANVIKVEPTGDGDWARTIGKRYGGHTAYSIPTNLGKRSIALDLKSDEGKQVLWRLISGADVLIERFRPGVLDRLGF